MDNRVQQNRFLQPLPVSSDRQR